jgi:dTDP-4-amino-4,6-dideoxygalactose transaminase
MSTPPQAEMRWPDWPEYDAATFGRIALPVVASRLAVSSPQVPFPGFLVPTARRFATSVGGGHAVLTSNGSSALVLALQALGVGPGDRVGVPALTWVACATAILHVGAEPVFFDSGIDSPCADPVAMDGDGPLKAIIVVHLYASRADVRAWRDAFPGVPIIEDCSHLHQARVLADGVAEARGDIAVFSLQATKSLTSGEGGAVLADDLAMAQRLQALSHDSRRYVSQCALGRVPLEPAHTIHGANHAMGELGAALLSDQLDRLDGQGRRRAEAVRAFRAGIDGAASLVADERVLTQGVFYGLSLVLREGQGLDGLIEDIAADTGVRAGRIYPPIPHSPLYLPHTRADLPQTPPPALRLEFAQHWHDRTIVLPHSIFLAAPELLERLGTVMRMRLAGVRARLRPASAPCSAPPVTVAMVTQGRPTLRAALASIRAQRYRGELRLLVIADESKRAFDPGLLSDEAADATVELVRVKSHPADAEPVIARIARLRNLAIDMTRTPLLAFLDDDNTWHPDHLDSLNQARDDGRYWAVHGWRKLVDARGEPLVPIGFPWLPRSALERKTFAACLALGLLTEGDPVVRDRISAIHDRIDYGMVDCGAWLFDLRLFRAIRFEQNYSDVDVAQCIGEDDKLLRAMRELGLPIACSERASLNYTVGGTFARGGSCVRASKRRNVNDECMRNAAGTEFAHERD